MRVARITVPVVAVGTLATGLAIAALPASESLSAVPSPSAVADRAVPDRATRDQARPAPKSTASVLPADPATSKTGQKSATPPKAESAAKPTQTAQVEAAKAAPKLDLTVVGSRYLSEDLNLRTEPEKKAKVLGVLDSRSKVRITDTVEHGFRLIVQKGKGRWVTDEYLAKKLPPKQSAISDASCDKDSSIESGLVSNGIKVYRALCAKFPNITSFGGRRAANGGFHPTGQAVDAMISNGGWEVARWVRANAKRLGVSEVIHARSIWTVQRSGEGWRSMPDRGDDTANHFDHVHVSVY